MARIQPLSPPYEGPVEASFADLTPPGVEPFALFRTVARSEHAWRKLRAGALPDPGPLSLRFREILVHRTCALTRCAYGWSLHATFLATAAGLTRDELIALAADSPEAGCWSAAETALVATADALHARATLGDAEWATLRTHFDESQVLEILMICGFQRTVSYFANGLALPLEPGAVALPA
jgi:alkylhydroperoxidase family enzyme